MIWFRGTLLDDDSLKLSVLDRTFEHGLGLFETLRTWNGHPTLLGRHLERLTHSARQLGLPLDPRSLPDPAAVKALLDQIGEPGDARLRITLSGGVHSNSEGMLWMRSQPVPPPRRGGGLKLGPCRPARTDPLASHKTLNYWPNRLYHEECLAQGFDECLLISPDGCLLEGCRSNLFLVAGGRLLTPAVDGRIVPGIMRRLVLERAAALGIETVETSLRLSGPQPDELFLTNAVGGIMAVERWGEVCFPCPGPITKRLRDDTLAWLESGG
jgi:branched-chain amino acid aminotransferase